jgi:hypothetical protein
MPLKFRRGMHKPLILLHEMKARDFVSIRAEDKADPWTVLFGIKARQAKRPAKTVSK